jgi:outer membrane autotransporter protein
MTASPNGTHWLAGAKAGYLMTFGPVRLGPVVGLDYADAKVDAYTESGDPTLTLNVGSTSAKALEGSLGAELRGNLTAGGAAIRPLLAATLVKDFQGEGQTIFFDQTVAPTIVNHWAVEGRSKRAYGRLTTGLSAQITNAISVDGLASATVSRKNGNDVSAQVGLKVGF